MLECFLRCCYVTSSARILMVAPHLCWHRTLVPLLSEAHGRIKPMQSKRDGTLIKEIDLIYKQLKRLKKELWQ